MTRQELISRLGYNIVSSYEIINEDCTNKGEFVFIGTTSAGIPAWVHRQVMEADFRIGPTALLREDLESFVSEKISLDFILSVRTNIRNPLKLLKNITKK